VVFVCYKTAASNWTISRKVTYPAINFKLVLIYRYNHIFLDYQFGETGIIRSRQLMEFYTDNRLLMLIGAVVVWRVIIALINLKSNGIFKTKDFDSVNAGWLAGLSFCIIYASPNPSGAWNHTNFETNITRIDCLAGKQNNLGAIAACVF